MKRNRVISSVISAVMTVMCLNINAAADEALTMNVDTQTVIKTNSAEMYGLSTDWGINSLLIKNAVATEGNPIDTAPNPTLVKGMNEYGLPLVRLGEEASRSFKWKDAVGPIDQRTEQELWGTTGKVTAGPLEIIKTYEAIDSNAAFTVTLNVESDTAQNAADFAQFLTGSTSTTWGAKRAEYGRNNPVNVKLFELGNEVDQGTGAMDVDTYIAKCKEFITAIKAVVPDAEFAVHASTGAYGGAKYILENGSNSETWRSWHKAILNDSVLAPQISFITLHTYFYANEGGKIVENCAKLVNDDIKTAGYEGKIKTFVSEYGLWFKDYDAKEVNTHNITGITETSDVISRMMWHPEVESMSYHGLNSGKWFNVVNDEANNRIYLNGIGNLLKLYKTYGVGDVLKTTLTGYETEKESDLAGVAVRNSDGNINYIFTNKSNSAKTVTITTNTSDTYKIKNEMRIAASSGTADIAVGTNAVNVNSYTYSDGAEFTQYTIPAYSVCAVETYKAENTTTVNEAFTYEENFDSVADGRLPDGWSATSGKTLAGVENGELVVEPLADWTTAVVRIPNTENVIRDGLTLEADMTLVSYNETTRTSGSRNKAGFAYMMEGDKRSTGAHLAFNNQAEITESGVSGQKNPTTSENFKNKTKVRLKLVFSGSSSPDVYVDGKLCSTSDTKITGTAQNVGSIGIMVLDAKAKFDNIKISGTRLKKADASTVKERTFTYEQNYDGIGTLPSEMQLFGGGQGTATVQDGALYINGKSGEWGSNAVLLNLDDVSRYGLEMECDITRVSAGTAQPSSEVAGFIYATKLSEEGKLDSTAKFSKAALYISNDSGDGIQQVSVADGDITSEWTPSVGTGKCLRDGATVKLKLKFTKDNQLYMYINGNEVVHKNNPSSGAQSENSGIDTGYVGLYVLRDASVKIDNLKITGKRDVLIDNSFAFDANLKTSGAVYNSAEEAEADVIVTAKGSNNEKYDITDEAEITSSASGGVCTIDVKYQGTTVKTITANILQQSDQSFRIEENFNSTPNGALPSGMQLFGGGQGTATVQDGALYINGKSGEWGSNAVLLNLDDVSRYGLEMECDITRVSAGTAQPSSEVAGFIYATKLSEEGKLDSTAKFSKAALYISNDSGDGIQQVSVADGDITSEWTPSVGTGKCLRDGATVKLKLKFTKDNQLYMYINGNEVVHKNNPSSGAQSENSGIDTGYVGLYVLRDASVKIDNLVISGTRSGFSNSTAEITKIESNKLNNGVSVSVNAKATEGLSDTAYIVGAVYEKSSGRLVSVTNFKEWDINNYPTYRTNLDMEGVSDYSADKYTVKVFVFDGTEKLAPLMPNIPSI